MKLLGVAEAELAVEGEQDLLLHLLHRVTVQNADVQRLAHLALRSHRKQHAQLLHTHTHTHSML